MASKQSAVLERGGNVGRGTEFIVFLQNELPFLFLFGLFAFFAFSALEAGTVAWSAWGVLLFGLSFMCPVIRLGRHSMAGRPEAERELSREAAVRRHRLYVRVVFTTLVVGIIGIEVAIMKAGGGRWGPLGFFAIHLAFAFGTLATFLIARFVHTGLASPGTHWKFAYSFLVFFIAVFITGTVLISQKFPAS